MTIAPAVLKDLSQAEETLASVASKSLYKEDIRKRQKQDVVSYLNEEAKWREAFEKSNHGKGVWKTAQVVIPITGTAEPWLTDVLGHRNIFRVSNKCREAD